MITRKELVGMMLDGGWTKADAYDSDKLKSRVKEILTEYREDQFSARHADIFKRLQAGEAFQTEDGADPGTDAPKLFEDTVKVKKEQPKTIVKETKPKAGTPIAAAKVAKEKQKPEAKKTVAKVVAKKSEIKIGGGRVNGGGFKKLITKSDTARAHQAIKKGETFPPVCPVKLAKPETTKSGPSPSDKKPVKAEQTELFKTEAVKSSPKATEEKTVKGMVDNYGNRLGSIAARVNAVLTNEWQTDQEIADKSGLSLFKVRGRLYFATNNDKIVECERLTRYRLPSKKA